MIRFILADLNRFRLGGFFIATIVALAVALGVAVTLQERALRLGSARAAEKFDLIVGAAGSETQLVLSSVFLQPSALPLMPGEVLRDLEADPRVAWAAPIGFGDFFGTSPIVGTTTTLVKNLSSGISEGAVFAREGDAVIGTDVPLQMGSTVKPMHGTLGEGGHTHTELAYTIVGRLKPTGSAWDRAIFVPIRAVWDIHGLGHHHDDGDEDHDHDHAAATTEAAKPAAGAPGHHDDHDDHDEHHAIDPNQPINEQWQGELPGLPAVVVKPKSIADAYKLRQQYRKDATLAVFPAEVLTTLYATLGDVKKVLSAVAAGAQLLVGAALILVIVMHVGQRRKQIGALRAFGAPREAVFGIVWLELFGLVSLGILAGLGLGYLAAHVIAARLATGSGFHMPVGFAPEDLASIAGLFIAAACLCALPAVIAYRQPPARALRG
jgi:putative ABC transport system permease protein